jgi:hypothetical protein
MKSHGTIKNGPLRDRKVESDTINGDTIVTVGGTQVAIITPNSGMTVDDIIARIEPKLD